MFQFLHVTFDERKSIIQIAGMSYYLTNQRIKESLKEKMYPVKLHLSLYCLKNHSFLIDHILRKFCGKLYIRGPLCEHLCAFSAPFPSRKFPKPTRFIINLLFGTLSFFFLFVIKLIDIVYIKKVQWVIGSGVRMQSQGQLVRVYLQQHKNMMV